MATLDFAVDFAQADAFNACWRPGEILVHQGLAYTQRLEDLCSQQLCNVLMPILEQTLMIPFIEALM